MEAELQVIKDKLGGCWTLDRSENFEEALAAMGELVLNYECNEKL